MVPKAQMPLVVRAIYDLVREYGHPDLIPIDELTAHGIPASFAQFLTAEDFPVDAATATARWVQLIGRHCIDPSATVPHPAEVRGRPTSSSWHPLASPAPSRWRL